MRFRLGCHDLPVVLGRRDHTPRRARICPCCRAGVGDEKHLVFECAALRSVRARFSHLFVGAPTMRAFMNQPAQRDVLEFIWECFARQ